MFLADARLTLRCFYGLAPVSMPAAFLIVSMGLRRFYVSSCLRLFEVVETQDLASL